MQSAKWREDGVPRNCRVVTQCSYVDVQVCGMAMQLASVLKVQLRQTTKVNSGNGGQVW